MNDDDALDAYLQRHYIGAEQLARACSIAADELHSLVDEGLAPQASYRVSTAGVLVSQAFGEFQAPGVTPGDYFHPGHAHWVLLASDLKHQAGAQRASEALRQCFKRNFIAALAEFDRTIFRLPDSFTDAGQAIPDGLDARAMNAWRAFIKGVYGLCVADPSSERSIARKEVLQEALGQLSGRVSEPSLHAEDKQRLRALITEYAEVCMPFSPLEYPRSSRKRLVEDLSARLDAA